MKKGVMTWMLVAGLSWAASTQAQTDNALQAALNGKERSAANVARDAARHPAQTLSFFGLKADMTVVELAPGGGWYTEILAPYLRDHGKLILAGVGPKLKTTLDAQAQFYDKVQIGVFEPANKIDFAAKNSVDMVLTFRNVHNWMSVNPHAAKDVFQSAYDALKSGGVFGVVEHRLPEAITHDEKGSTGYVHQSHVIQLAESVGFKLLAQSEMNANPKDNAKHENGVWALPPTLINKDKDQAQYLSIGESDRMTLKFVKP